MFIGALYSLPLHSSPLPVFMLILPFAICHGERRGGGGGGGGGGSTTMFCRLIVCKVERVCVCACVRACVRACGY